MSWYREDDGKIITDEEFQDSCYNCLLFCAEGTISVPCNGERTDCPDFKEVDTSEYDKEIRNKTIDEFVERLKNEHKQTITTESVYISRSFDEVVDEIAEKMRGAE